MYNQVKTNSLQQYLHGTIFFSAYKMKFGILFGGGGGGESIIIIINNFLNSYTVIPLRGYNLTSLACYFHTFFQIMATLTSER